MTPPPTSTRPDLLGPRAGRRTSAAVLAGVAVAVVALLASTLGAGARTQAVGAPFPAPIVAPVDSGEVEPELDISGIYRVNNDDPANPVVGVAFASGFTEPTSDYRVSVLVGDPAGARVRASYLAGAPGTLETGDGTTFTPSGETSASFNAATGVYEITVPVADQPDGASVWAEVQSGDTTETSPVFSLDSLLGRAVSGGLPSGSLGDITDADGNPTGETLSLGPGPSLAVVNQGMTVTYPEAPPTELGGVAVTSVIDRIQLAPDFDMQALTVDSVEIDRTAQTVQLVDGYAVPPAPVSSDTSTWFLGGFPASGTGALTFELGEISNLLGFQLIPDSVGAGVVRTVVLADGRTVSSTPVLATLDWFGATAGETASTTTTAPADTSEASDEEDTRRQLLTIGAAVLAGVLAIAGIALIASARRKRHGHRILGEHADDRGVVDWTAEMEAVRIDDEPTIEPAPVEPAPSGAVAPEAPPSEADAPAAAVPEAAATEADDPIQQVFADAAEVDDPGPSGDSSGDPAAATVAGGAAAAEHRRRGRRRRAREEEAHAAEAPDEVVHDEVVHDEVAGASGDAGGSGRAPAPSHEAPTASSGPAFPDPLADLASEIGELSSRLGRLGDPDTPPS